MNEKKTQIMDEPAVFRTLMRMSHQIVERNPEEEAICVFGVRRRGAVLGKQIAENVRQISGKNVEFGELDVTLYRDDINSLSENQIVNITGVDFSIKDKTVILVDDVLFTGRTVRAAIEAVLKLGRPACIQLAVLVDR